MNIVEVSAGVGTPSLAWHKHGWKTLLFAEIADAPRQVLQQRHGATIAFDCKASGRNGFSAGELSPTLRAMGHKDSHANAGGEVAVAFGLSNQPTPKFGVNVSPSLDSKESGGGRMEAVVTPMMAVRLLTPRECERLQGLPDGFTAVLNWREPTWRYSWLKGRMTGTRIPRLVWECIEDDALYHAKQGFTVRLREDGRWQTNILADGPRYKMVGNGMAKPVLEWIGDRIAMVERIPAESAVSA